MTLRGSSTAQLPLRPTINGVVLTLDRTIFLSLSASARTPHSALTGVPCGSAGSHLQQREWAALNVDVLDHSLGADIISGSDLPAEMSSTTRIFERTFFLTGDDAFLRLDEEILVRVRCVYTEQRFTFPADLSTDHFRHDVTAGRFQQSLR